MCISLRGSCLIDAFIDYCILCQCSTLCLWIRFVLVDDFMVCIVFAYFVYANTLLDLYFFYVLNDHGKVGYCSLLFAISFSLHISHKITVHM